MCFSLLKKHFCNVLNAQYVNEFDGKLLLRYSQTNGGTWKFTILSGNTTESVHFLQNGIPKAQGSIYMFILVPYEDTFV